jgi:hydrogenase expression/formation protein HypC
MCLAVPGRVIAIRDDAGVAMGTVDFDGLRRDVCLACVADEVTPGDYVLVHVGFALARVDEAEARRTLTLLREAVGRGDGAWPAADADP